MLRAVLMRLGGASKKSTPPTADGARKQGTHDVVKTLDDVALHADDGWLSRALQAVNQGLERFPNHPQLLVAKSTVLYRWGRMMEAHKSATRAEEHGANGLAFYLQIGWTSFQVGDLQGAERWMRRAVAEAPSSYDSHFNLAYVLFAKNETLSAAQSYAAALRYRPLDFDALIGTGTCALNVNNYRRAEEAFRSAIEVRPESPAAWSHLGVALARQLRDEEALQAFQRASALNEITPGDDDTFVNLAILLRDMGRIGEALEIFEANLPVKPSIDAHYAYAHGLLRAGRLREGWEQHEFRWMCEPLRSLRLPPLRPTWSGQDLNGKRVLLRDEQGAGDAIQFVRYAPRMKALGAEVYYAATDAMAPLAQEIEGIHRVFRTGDSLPDFDYCIHLMSLPRVFGATLETIPGDVPYLQARNDRLDRWRARLIQDDTLKVGLVWAGSASHPNDRFRSVNLDALASIADVEGITLYSLQKGPPIEQLEANPRWRSVVDLGRNIDDFQDTAAVLTLLDVLVTVDTSVAHLAGALGREVWMLVADPPDFRWLDETNKTVWYPTMRLFRQTRRADWTDPVQALTTALQERARRSARGVPRLTPAPDPPMSSPVTDVATQFNTGIARARETRVGIVQYLPDDRLTSRSVENLGEYLQEHVDLLRSLVPPGGVVLETHADVGLHALALAEIVTPSGHVLLSETRPVHNQILRQNLGANRVAGVTVLRGAVSGAGCADESVALNAENGKAPRAFTVDELQLERLDALKLNDASTALDVLSGAADSLWRLRPVVLIRCSDDDHLWALIERMRQFGYRCWTARTPLFSSGNFNCCAADPFGGASQLSLVAVPEEGCIQVQASGWTEAG